MEFLYLIQGFFGAPGLVIGLFALIGSILMHKKPTDIILSTLTTILGFFLLACGGAAMGAALVHFSNVFKALVGSDAAIGNCDALALLIIKDAPKMAAVVALMLLVSMILNLVLARTSKYKDIHLSSHHILYLCVGLVIMLEFAGLNMNLNSTDALFAVIFGGILMSLYMTLTPQLTKPAMRQLTGEDKMYIAHYNTFAASLGVLFGYLFERYGERKSRSAEDINMPKWLSFFKHSTITVIITMLVILTIVYISCWAVHGKDYFIEIAGGGVSGSTSIPVIIITDSFAFAAGLEALIFGVKMMVKGLVEPLEGISRRAIPNAKMCIDSAVIIDKQPTAVLIAFISSLTGGLLVTGLSFGLAKLAPAVFTMIMIPSLPTHFLSSGACGIMANSRGGIKACIIAPFLCGIIFSFMPLVFGIIYNTMGDGFGNIPQISDIRINNPSDWASITALGWGEADYAWIALVSVFLKLWLPSRWIILSIAILIFLSLSLIGMLSEFKDKKNNPMFYFNFHLNNLNSYLQLISERQSDDMRNESTQINNILLNRNWKNNTLNEKIKKYQIMLNRKGNERIVLPIQNKMDKYNNSINWAKTQIKLHDNKEYYSNQNKKISKLITVWTIKHKKLNDEYQNLKLKPKSQINKKHYSLKIQRLRRQILQSNQNYNQKIMKVKNHFKYIYKKQDMSINKINFKIANLQKNNKATGAK